MLFFASIEMIIWSFTLLVVNIVYYIGWFAYVEPSLWTWDEFHLFVLYHFFLCVVGFGLLIFCWEFLHLYSSKILVCSILCWWYLCLILVSGWGGFIWECCSLFSLLEEFEKNLCKIFVFWVEFVIPPGSRLLLVWSFLLQILFHFQWSVYSNYLFFLDLALVIYMFLESCPFLLGWQICWHIIFHSILLCFFCCCTISWDF